MSSLIKVSANSLTTAVAGAIAGIIREQRSVDVQAIGASAVNQAVKAVAIARGYLEGDNIDIVCVPHFVDVDIAGQERTALRLSVESRDMPPKPAAAAGEDDDADDDGTNVDEE